MKNIYVSCIALVCTIHSISRAQESSLIGYSTVYQSTMVDYEMDKNIDPSALIKPNFKGRADVPSFDNSPHQPDLVWQQHENLEKAAAATVVWSVSGLGANLSPPDPSGDVDSLVYIQGTNGGGGAVYRVVNKLTGATITSSVTMQTLGGPAGAGDPIILYHKPTRQWIITEFSSSGNRLIVHVSPVGSYTGTYFTSTFTCPNFPDYPKYAIYAGSDALMVSSNEGAGSPVYAIKLSAVLAGTTSPFLRTTVPDLTGFGFQGITPVDLEGDVAFPAGQKPMYIRHKDDEVHGGATAGTDQSEIYEATIVWTGTPSITATKLQSVLIADFDSDLCGLTSFNCFPQPGTTQKLDPLREQVMYKPVVRIFPTHQAMVLAFTTDVNGANRGGVRWVELRRPTGSIGTWTKYQEGTYAPGTTNRWMPSINIDKNGSILIAYSTSSSAAGDFASLRYTGRKACDALGTMTIPEGTIVAGTSARTSNERWGDYFHMSIDPYNEETFYFTGDFVASGGAMATRIAAIKINREANDAKLILANLVTPNPICAASATIGLKVQNFGSSTLTGGTIKYQINGGAFSNQSFTSTLATDSSTTVNMIVSGIVNGSNTVKFIVENANSITPDEYNCNDTLTFTFNAVTNVATLSATASAANCGSSNGSVSASLVGGLANGASIVYTINGLNPQSSGNFTNLPAGNYVVTATDPLGCATTSPSVTVNVGAGVLATQSQTNVNCFGQNSGTANVVASSGLAPYTYLWSNGSTLSSTTALPAGNQTCTITDANGCTNVQSFTITQESQITSTFTSTNATCGAANGSATLTPSGGNGPYTYLWQNGTTNPTLSGVNAGMYNCAVTDASGCSVTRSAMVNSTSGPTLTIAQNSPAICFQDPSGYLEVNATAGVGPYTYLWSPSGGTDALANGLLAGTYNCQVTAANGCITFITSTISEPPAITVALTVEQPQCEGVLSGIVSSIVSNTVGAVNYAWSNGDSQPGTITGLIAFPYTLIITDSRNCQGTGSVVVPLAAAPVLAYTSSPATCFGTATGSATMSATGGVTPYTYLWSGSGGTASISNPLPAGTHTATVTGANGCSDEYTFTIAEPDAIISSATATNATCFGGNNGSLSVTATGGTGAFTFNTNAVTNTTGNFTGLASNPYLITITDANGCVTTTTQTVGQATAIVVNATPIAISCFQGSNGSIQVTASGGAGGYTYSRNGVGYQGASVFNGLTVGNYTIYVKDANGCIKTFATSIVQPSLLSVSGVSTPNNGTNNATITLTGTGGVSPYTYSFNGGAFGSATLFSNLASGTYSCVIKDDNGCSKTINITITGPSADLSDETVIPIVDVKGIYPNPSSGQFTLNLSNVENDIDLRIFNTEGRMIAQFGIQNEKGDVTKIFELSSKIAPGIYFLGVYETLKQPKILRIEKM